MAIPGTNIGSASYGSRGGPNARWDDWYKSYMDRAKKYEGTEYYDLLMANPYLQFQEYSETFGDQIAQLFGSTAGRDRFYQERMNQGDEYFSNVIAQIQANEHNSTASQVERDKLAGLNPALSGDVSSAGEQSPLPPDETPPVGNTAGAESMQALGDIASVGLSFANGILQFAQGCQSLGINAIGASAQQTAMASSMYDFILKSEAGNLPLPAKLEDGTYDFASVPTEALDAVFKKGNRKNPFQGPAAALYSRLRGQILYDKEGRPTSALERAWRENVAGAASNTKSAAEAMSLPGFSFDDFYGFAGQIGEHITNMDLKIKEYAAKVSQHQAKIAELEEKIRSAQAPAAIAEAGFNTEYYENLDGAAAAADQSDQFDLNKELRKVQKLKAQFDQYIMESRKALVESVRGNGRWYNHAGMLLLPGLLSSIDAAAAQTFQPGALTNAAGAAAGKSIGKAIMKAVL